MQYNIVLEYNYALLKSASQSNTYFSKAASRAVDGMLSTLSVATKAVQGGHSIGDYWWKVDFGQRVIFKQASIYVRNGRWNGENSLEFCKSEFLPRAKLTLLFRFC